MMKSCPHMEWLEGNWVMDLVRKKFLIACGEVPSSLDYINQEYRSTRYLVTFPCIGSTCYIKKIYF